MVKAWDYQKEKLEERYSPTPGQLREIIKGIDNPRDQFYLCLTYLTGGRVGEVIDIKPTDIDITERNGIKVLVISMKNEKAKRFRQKMIPIRFDLEGDFIALIMRYILNVKGTLFGFKTRQRGWQIFRKYGLNPHFFRHLRATHMVQYRGYKSHQMNQFFGWSDMRSSSKCVHLNWEDLI